MTINWRIYVNWRVSVRPSATRLVNCIFQNIHYIRYTLPRIGEYVSVEYIGIEYSVNNWGILDSLMMSLCPLDTVLEKVNFLEYIYVYCLYTVSIYMAEIQNMGYHISPHSLPQKVPKNSGIAGVVASSAPFFEVKTSSCAGHH